MDTRLFCLIIDRRGHYRVSCRDEDLDRIAPSEYFASFDKAYASAMRLNRARVRAAKKDAQHHEHSSRL